MFNMIELPSAFSYRRKYKNTQYKKHEIIITTLDFLPTCLKFHSPLGLSLGLSGLTYASPMGGTIISNSSKIMLDIEILISNSTYFSILL